MIVASLSSVDESQCAGNEAETIENSRGNELLVNNEGHSEREPFVGMEFDSEEAAKVFYDAYATKMGFIMRVDAFRRSMRDGNVVWRRLVCNKEGFRKCRPKRSESRKPRAITREGCKAMIVVKKRRQANGLLQNSSRSIITHWLLHLVITVEVHSYLKPHSGLGYFTTRFGVSPAQRVHDEKDMKIRELTAELQRERRRSALLQEQLNSILKDMEEHSKHLSRNITNIVQSVNEIESRRIVFPSS
ncbi:protein FAR1-RELATED SEQUENCE 5 [Sesamum angolense]|uniref:Protein FAR1-RELATED SEQUENCE 5 n=1 Tax=Sesamum angolense TaxID=2727404 RepID=A0AAE2C4F5_9LAMI|nr:protein FAR1-RELATED SEQUENCE 5 [Sesamum angolense]